MNMHTKMISFTSAIPVPKGTHASTPLIYGELPETKALQVNHFGRYTRLGNAWSAAIALIVPKLMNKSILLSHLLQSQSQSRL